MDPSIGPPPDRLRICGTAGRDDAQVFAGVNYGSIHYAADREDPSKKLIACRNALFLTDPKIDRDSLISAKGNRAPGTCEWIKEDVIYQNWYRGDTPLLWISGGPGKGKTMLSIFITEHLEGSIRPSEGTVVLYYFCANNDVKRNDSVAVLRGLLWQITDKRPELTERLLTTFDQSEDTETLLSSPENLWSMFVELVQHLDVHHAYCVVDGLDECDEVSSRWLAMKFRSLTCAGSRASMFNTIILSRRISGLGQIPQLNIDPDNDRNVSRDIQKFVSSQVQELSSSIIGFSKDFRRRVKRALSERSEGTFLWVGYAMAELKRCKTCLEVEETLRSLPKGLHAIYGRILLQIEASHSRQCSSILCWVTMASRPLSLEMLASAVPVPSMQWLTKGQVIRDHVVMCRGLLMIQDDRVSFVHQSVREYLLRNQADSNAVLEEFRIKPKEAHLRIAKTCLDYIQHSGLKEVPRLDKSQPQLAKRKPFIDYSVQYWPKHARASSNLAKQLLEHPSSMFGKKSTLRAHWWMTFRRSNNVPTSLYMAAYLGITPWAEKLLARSWRSWKPRLKERSLALTQAAWRGHLSIVQLLLDRGTNINGIGWTLFSRKKSTTALFFAAMKGDEAMVRFLLERGANVDLQAANLETPLHRAAKEGDKAIVQMLLDRGADINIRAKKGMTATHFTVESGCKASHKEVLKLLLEHDADITAKDVDERTALLCAARWRDVTMVEMLLKHGADIRAIDGDHRTALHLAAHFKPVYERASARRTYRKLFNMLLDWGADINAKNLEGETVLHYAVSQGETKLVQLLLDREADTNAKNSEGQTVLHYAVSVGDMKMTKQLLDNGVNVNEKTSEGQRVLHIAASDDDTDMMKLLLDYGVDVNSKNPRKKQTVLHYAASVGDIGMIKLLLDSRIDINARDVEGHTALDVAIKTRHEKTARLLRSHGSRRPSVGSRRASRSRNM